jgi:hypothetical protein
MLSEIKRVGENRKELFKLKMRRSLVQIQPTATNSSFINFFNSVHGNEIIFWWVGKSFLCFRGLNKEKSMDVGVFLIRSDIKILI